MAFIGGPFIYLIPANKGGGLTERAIQGERTSCAPRRRERALECAIRYEDVPFSYKPGVPFMEGLSGHSCGR
ncbi:MAG: hypothetical protein ACLTEX_03205 [Eggerthella lenta]